MEPEHDVQPAFVPATITPSPALTPPVAAPYAPGPVEGLIGRPANPAAGAFDPSAYRMTVDPGRGGILLRALATVMHSRSFLAAARQISDEGGATIRWDETTDRQAYWDLPSRTIFLNPTRIERASMVIAGILAFELGNASQAREFGTLLESVRTGGVSDAQQYAERAERIEYRSAQLRARDGADLILRGTWSIHVDPTLRHFIPKGQDLQPAFGQLIRGDGLWTTFEGYQQTQLITGHTQGLVERFALLPQRKAFLRSPEGIKAEATLRYRQRQRQKAISATGQPVANPSLGPPVSTREPEAFVVADDRHRLRGDDAQRQIFRGTDGHVYQLLTVIDGDFYFKPIG